MEQSSVRLGGNDLSDASTVVIAAGAGAQLGRPAVFTPEPVAETGRSSSLKCLYGKFMSILHFMCNTPACRHLFAGSNVSAFDRQSTPGEKNAGRGRTVGGLCRRTRRDASLLQLEAPVGNT